MEHPIIQGKAGGPESIYFALNYGFEAFFAGFQVCGEAGFSQVLAQMVIIAVGCHFVASPMDLPDEFRQFFGNPAEDKKGGSGLEGK